MKILLAVTGSIAAKLTSRLEKELVEAGHEIQIVATEASANFTEFSYLNDVYRDEDEWRTYRNDSEVLHVELVRWCDAMIVAPCTANTLAKMANGISDNLVSCCIRALPQGKPLLFAPAMNTQMWNHPMTQRHLQTVIGLGYYYVEPQEKTLYCGDTGMGAMANISDIVRVAGIIQQRHGASGAGET